MNIYVTVGTQLPFDRLVAAVDRWAAGRSSNVFGQTGKTGYRPKHMDFSAFMAADEANERIRAADLVIAHAGMGTILTRLEIGKPMIIMPRRAELGEHRNDHQLATASRLAHLEAIRVAQSEAELLTLLEGFAPGHCGGIGTTASPRLIAAIRSFAGLQVAAE